LSNRFLHQQVWRSRSLCTFFTGDFPIHHWFLFLALQSFFMSPILYYLFQFSFLRSREQKLGCFPAGAHRGTIWYLCMHTFTFLGLVSQLEIRPCSLNFRPWPLIFRLSSSSTFFPFCLPSIGDVLERSLPFGRPRFLKISRFDKRWGTFGCVPLFHFGAN